MDGCRLQPVARWQRPGPGRFGAFPSVVDELLRPDVQDQRFRFHVDNPHPLHIEDSASRDCSQHSQPRSQLGREGEATRKPSTGSQCSADRVSGAHRDVNSISFTSETLHTFAVERAPDWLPRVIFVQHRRGDQALQPGSAQRNAALYEQGRTCQRHAPNIQCLYVWSSSVLPSRSARYRGVYGPPRSWH